MTVVTPLLGSFNGGELSPLMAGRADLPKYASGADTIENFIIRLPGPLERRGGTRFIHEVKDSTKQVWLPRFSFNRGQSYILEQGPLYFRFFTQRGILLNGGVPYEIAHSYDVSDLTNADGTYRPRYVQSGDDVFFCIGSQRPKLLSRLAATNWTWGDFPFVGGPFKDENDNSDIRVVLGSVAEIGGSVGMVANYPIFLPGHVGSLFQLRGFGAAAVPAWATGQVISSVNTVRYNDGKYYHSANTGTTGTLPPTHNAGTISDGVVLWTYRHANIAYVLITAVFPDGRNTTVTMMSNPDGDFTLGIGAETPFWSFGAWSDVEGWPTSVCFYRDRLVFGRDRRIWTSVAGDYFDFAGQKAGEILPESAISVQVATGRADEIQWLAATDDLLAGTAGGIAILTESTAQLAFGPGNVRVKPGPAAGVASIQPVETPTTQALYIDSTYRRIREIGLDGNDRYIAPDINRLAEHVLKPGVIDICYQAEIESALYALTAEGQLAVNSYDAGQQVYAWSRFAIGGTSDSIQSMPAVVEAIQCIPSPSGLVIRSDDLWMIVRRQINGVTRRYVELLDLGFISPARRVGETIEQYQSRVTLLIAACCFTDSSLTFYGAIQQTLTPGSGATVKDATNVLFTSGGAAFEGKKGQFIHYDHFTTAGFSVRAIALIDEVPSTTTCLVTIITPWPSLSVIPAGAWRMTVSHVSGLDHLEGQTVSILADGAVQGPAVVTGGGMSLENPASYVTIGLPYPSVWVSMSPEVGSRTGTSQGRKKRAARAVLRVLNTFGGSVGGAAGKVRQVDLLNFRDPATPMGQSSPLFTGDVEIMDASGHSRDGRMAYRTDLPLPATLVAIMPQMTVGDD